MAVCTHTNHRPKIAAEMSRRKRLGYLNLARRSSRRPKKGGYT